ncbi:MBL fold metallo-hydrolase [Rhizosaccharibacter radicis]|uniref:MBL fold metallo-hydrolase n=1 Tax=Rhizosaccharibacter radicis TaxID=2782605 RepID=A0ABT1VUE5_9PROT|nr:MBL fold metallo-hydrolase [Acetobacteraceae bacterium KSS12]
MTPDIGTADPPGPAEPEGAPRDARGRFHNPPLPGGAATGGHGLLPVLRWQWRRRHRRAVWPDRIIDPPPPGDPHAVPPAGHAALTFLGHSGFLLRLPGAAGACVTLLFDPVFSERCSPVQWAGPKRVRAPGRSLDAIPLPDLVLVSHNHYDHMDLPGLRALRRRARQAGRSLRVVAPLNNARHLRHAGIEDVTELDWWQAAHPLPGLHVIATPARHFSARTPFDRNEALWSGFMVRTDTARILFAGDSGQGPHWHEIRARLGAPDIAMLPIGAYEPREIMAAVHMNPAEAVAAHLALGARRSVGMHFGTFQLTDEAIDAPASALETARQAARVTEEAFRVPALGRVDLITLDGERLRPA